jgi:ATP-dependent Clp protease ATP-binding subunit ClpX
MAGGPARRRWRPKLRCSFCGRGEDEVERLVAGKSAHICDSCIGACVTVLEQHGGFDKPGPNHTH